MRPAMRERPGLLPVTVRDSTHELLIQQGYKLIDDAWSLNGSLTYDHNDDATHEFIASLAKVSGAPVGRPIQLY